MDNYIKQEKAGTRIQVLLCDRQIVTELSSDFTLPDYQPEIKRLLRVKATVLPADQYVGAGSAEFSGAVDYTVLYCGNDGALYCTAQREEYRIAAPMEYPGDLELSDGLVCDLESIAETVTGRVIAPRKVSLRCRLRSQARIRGTRVLTEETAGDCGNAVERLCGQMECARVFSGVGEPLSLADEILLDGQSNDLRVIYAEGQVFVTEAVAGSGTVNCRGEISLKLLCTRESESGVTSVMLRRIPFAQGIFVDGAEVNCMSVGDGVCTELRITVEDGRILCEVTAVLRARAQRNETVAYTRDLYSTVSTCEAEYMQLQVPVALGCVNGNVSVNTTLPLQEVGLKSGVTVADLSLTPTVTSLEREQGKFLLGGRCRCHVIAYDGEDYAAQEFEIPFRYEADGVAAEIKDYEVTVTPISCRARADGERMNVDAELAISLCARGEGSFRLLREARFGEPIEQKGAVCTICYPSAKDTLWSVAKRYHKPITEVSERNSLAGAPAADSRESLQGVRFLLV